LCNRATAGGNVGTARSDGAQSAKRSIERIARCGQQRAKARGMRRLAAEKNFSENVTFERNRVAQIVGICTNTFQFFPELACVESSRSEKRRSDLPRRVTFVFCSG
jgi:hypothetical protein